MAVCLILVILTDNLCKGNDLFSVFHNAFGTPELQHKINERLYFLVIRLYTCLQVLLCFFYEALYRT